MPGGAPEDGRVFETAAAVAEFSHLFPGLPYLSPCWPTRDHVIPWKLFWLMYAQRREVV